MASLLFVLQLASTWTMVGVIWFVQVVHYPLLASVGIDGFAEYERENCRRTGYVVIPPMLVELVTAFLMLVYPPRGTPGWACYAGLALLVTIWLSTFALQAPCHARLSAGFDPRLHRRLVRTNWLRTVAWSARGLLLAWCAWQPSY